MNERSSSLLFFLDDGSDAGERIAVSDWRTKTDSESPEPSPKEMRRQQAHQECCT